MAEPVFLSYVGAVTGITGAILGFIGYRQSREMKAVDLRLQIGRAENEVRVSLEHLPELMAMAQQSRTNLTSATGQAGALQVWNNAVGIDRETVASLTAQISAKGADYEELNPAALAAQVVTLHRLALLASRLTDKYKASLAEDDRAREERRADMRVRGV